MKFIVAKEVFDALPDAFFGVVAARGIDNHKKLPEVEELLQKNIADCEKYFEDKKVKEAEEIICYREAFRSLGYNPNKYMCSIEALISRIAKKKGFPCINSVVDMGNAVSIENKVPMGAHDLDTMTEDLYVRPAVAEDTFIAFGAGEADKETPDPSEIVYVSGNEVRTRRWTWRQSEIGKITEESKTILFPIDGFYHINEDKVLKAQKELAELLTKWFGCEVMTGLIDKEHPECEIIFK